MFINTYIYTYTDIYSYIYIDMYRYVVGTWVDTLHVRVVMPDRAHQTNVFGAEGLVKVAIHLLIGHTHPHTRTRHTHTHTDK